MYRSWLLQPESWYIYRQLQQYNMKWPTYTLIRENYLYSKGLRSELFDTRYCDEPSRGGIRRRRRARLQGFNPSHINEYRVEDLFQYDHAGWTPIHYSAFLGYHDVVDILLTEVPLLTNLPTADNMQTTPLLLAVMGNNLAMVQQLLAFNADYTFVDWQVNDAAFMFHKPRIFRTVLVNLLWTHSQLNAPWYWLHNYVPVNETYVYVYISICRAPCRHAYGVEWHAINGRPPFYCCHR